MRRVFVNGTFDIIHPGHIELLKYAKALGDHLLVAIDSDDRVKQLKGPTRPINTASNRKILLQNLKSVDSVAIFRSEEELVNIIIRYAPDVMVIGSDYCNKRVVGSEHVRALKFFKRLEQYSSTSIIEKIRNENSICATNV